MGSGLVKSLANIATMGAYKQYQAQKDALNAQTQAQMQANLIQQQALEQQKAAAKEQNQLQQKELAAQTQTNEMQSKYTVSSTKSGKEIDKNTADLTKGLGGGALPTTKKTLGADDEEFNQWY